MPGFDVTLAELQATAALLSQIGDEVHAELARLRIAAGDLLDGGWRGQSATMFEQGWAQWRTGADELIGALETMARLLMATGHDYVVADADSTRALGLVLGRS